MYYKALTLLYWFSVLWFLHLTIICFEIYEQSSLSLHAISYNFTSDLTSTYSLWNMYYHWCFIRTSSTAFRRYCFVLGCSLMGNLHFTCWLTSTHASHRLTVYAVQGSLYMPFKAHYIRHSRLTIFAVQAHHLRRSGSSFTPFKAPY